MRHLSIRWKLTLWYGFILALLLTAFSTAVYWTMRHHLLERTDEGLAEELSDVRYEIERASDTPGLSTWLDRRFAKHEGFDFQISHENGARLFSSERVVDRALPLPKSASIQPGYETIDLGPVGRWRMISQKVRGPDGPLKVQVARSMATFEHESHELLWAFLFAGPLTVIATLAGGHFLARRTLAPVRRMSETARRISAEQFQHRLGANNPHDELGQLASTLNEMLNRLERSFSEMQRFTADAAHELRTPLAVIRNEAEVALRQPRSGVEYDRVLVNVLEETVRLSRMADELLYLCRQDAGLNPPTTEVIELAPLLEEIVGNMRLVAQEKGVSLTLEAESGGKVRGDLRQLRRVFYNLIDNAVKYTPTEGHVRVVCRLGDGEMSAVVADTGIGIPAEHLPRIFDRFYRVDPARAADGSGAGLGLAICRSALMVSGGAIAVKSVVGSGTEFTVRLPVEFDY